MENLYLGSQVTVMSRVLTVVAYTDIATGVKQKSERENTFAMVKPCSYGNLGKIIEATENAGFLINRLKMSKFNRASASVFYAEHVEKPFFPNLQEFMTSDVAVGMELIADGGIKGWRSFIGPTNSLKAKEEAPDSIRAKFGTDGTKNSVHGSDSTESAARELGFFFESGDMKTTAVLNNCTLCIIKPHILREKKLGQVLDTIISAGFEVSALELFNLSRAQIEEFYSVYKGVLPEYLPIIEHLSNGPAVMLEVRQENAVSTFREFVGPNDPEIGKYLAPESLRAKFGLDRVKNVCHCTDLAEDGVLECEYFFSRLQGQ
jgi:nucleoside-diphosphate kinase